MPPVTLNKASDEVTAGTIPTKQLKGSRLWGASPKQKSTKLTLYYQAGISVSSLLALSLMTLRYNSLMEGALRHMGNE